MRELGYVDGRNLLIEYRWAAGNEQRLKAMAAELVQSKVDVIVAASTYVIQAASNATKTIPIVMSAAADPVGTGLVGNLARPGGNITGLSVQTNDIAGKLIQLAREASPDMTRVALFAVGPTPATALLIASLRVVAQRAGIRLTAHVIARSDEIAPTFERMRRDATQFEQPVKFELVINLRTAKAVGVTIPQSLLQRADDVLS